MHPMLNIAVRAARSAGGIIARSLGKVETLKIDLKGKNDFVTEVDRTAEREIIRVLRNSFPSHGILAEESGFDKGDEYVWIIDPLDGTINFLHGFPQFAVSIALQHKGRIEQAVVFEPIRQELFTATRGSGAVLNDRRIRVTSHAEMQGALLGTGFPFKSQKYLDVYLEMFRSLFADTAGIRRTGSAALDLAWVAAGRLDGFWEIGLQAWDMAAGVLLIQEAGGLVSDFAGNDEYLKSGNIICGNPKLHRLIQSRIEALATPELLGGCPEID